MDDEDLEEYMDELADEMQRIGCYFPGECCMPGEHLMSECHTAEMIEEWERQYQEEARADDRPEGCIATHCMYPVCHEFAGRCLIDASGGRDDG